MCKLQRFSYTPAAGTNTSLWAVTLAATPVSGLLLQGLPAAPPLARSKFQPCFGQNYCLRKVGQLSGCVHVPIWTKAVAVPRQLCPTRGPQEGLRPTWALWGWGQGMGPRPHILIHVCTYHMDSGIQTQTPYFLLCLTAPWSRQGSLCVRKARPEPWVPTEVTSALAWHLNTGNFGCCIQQYSKPRWRVLNQVFQSEVCCNSDRHLPSARPWV